MNVVRGPSDLYSPDSDVETGHESIGSNSLTSSVMPLIKDILSSSVHLIKFCDVLKLRNTTGRPWFWCKRGEKSTPSPVIISLQAPPPLLQSPHARHDSSRAFRLIPSPVR